MSLKSTSRSGLKLFTEIGIGNRYFISTEIENGLQERRVRGFMRMRITGVYLRLWIWKRVLILASSDGVVRQKKPVRRFKFLLGFQGVPLNSRA